MAELGVIASVVQIADTGLRLSIKLFTFGEIVASADKSVISLSKDVSLTSSVLKELGHILENDGKDDAKFLTQTAIKTADDVVKECLQVFKEMENLIVKKLPHLRAPGVEKSSKATLLLERLKWPYLQPKLQLLQSNLDRLKSTILLMLNVITYARQVAAKHEPETAIADQISLIEDLAQSNQDYIKTFENLKLGIEGQSSIATANQPSSNTEAIPSFQPEVNLLNISSLPRGNDTRLTNLQHYIDMLTTMLHEVDELKYQIQVPSRSRVRSAIHDTFDQEMHFLAHPFGDDLSKRVRDHFASLVAASRNKWNVDTRSSSHFAFSDSCLNSIHARSSAPALRSGRNPSVAADLATNLDHDSQITLDSIIAENPLPRAPSKNNFSRLVDFDTMPSEEIAAAYAILNDVSQKLEGTITTRMNELMDVALEKEDCNENSQNYTETRQLMGVVAKLYSRLYSIESRDANIRARREQLIQQVEDYRNSLDAWAWRMVPEQPRMGIEAERDEGYPDGRERGNAALYDYKKQLQSLEPPKSLEQASQQQIDQHQAHQQQTQQQAVQQQLNVLQPMSLEQSVQQRPQRHQRPQRQQRQQPRQRQQSPRSLLSSNRDGRSYPSMASEAYKPLSRSSETSIQPGWIFEDGSTSPRLIHGKLVSAAWAMPKKGKPRKQLGTACTTCREKKIKCHHALERQDSHSEPSQAKSSSDASQKTRCSYPECGRYFTDITAHLQTHIAERPEKGVQHDSDVNPRPLPSSDKPNTPTSEIGEYRMVTGASEDEGGNNTGDEDVGRATEEHTRSLRDEQHTSEATAKYESTEGMDYEMLMKELDPLIWGGERKKKKVVVVEGERDEDFDTRINERGAREAEAFDGGYQLLAVECGEREERLHRRRNTGGEDSELEDEKEGFAMYRMPDEEKNDLIDYSDEDVAEGVDEDDGGDSLRWEDDQLRIMEAAGQARESLTAKLDLKESAVDKYMALWIVPNP